jgi:hypothetical protein
MNCSILLQYCPILLHLGKEKEVCGEIFKEKGVERRFNAIRCKIYLLSLPNIYAANKFAKLLKSSRE